MTIVKVIFINSSINYNPQKTTNTHNNANNTNNTTTHHQVRQQIEAFKDFDDIEEEDDESVIDEKDMLFGNGFNVDLNIDGDDDHGNDEIHHDNVKKRHHTTTTTIVTTTTSILNTTHDHDISYDKSINGTSFSNLKRHYKTVLANQQTTHNQHIDDILLQLSSIESTYHDEISTLQKTC